MPVAGSQLSAAQLSAMLDGWRSRDGTLSIALAAAIAHLVESEKLASGVRLPAQRSLAAELEIARGTVTTAYEILAGGGYVTAEVGRGSTVSPVNRHRLRTVESFEAGASPVAVDLSTQSLSASDAFIDVLGLVGPSSLRAYLQTDGHHAHGLATLRNAVARYLTAQGTPTVAEQILVTGGAQQALWLTVFALTEQGDTVTVEDPTYRGILAVLAGIGRHLRVDPRPASDYRLERRTHPLPALVYVQSSVHSPSGQVRPDGMLRDLADSVNRHGLTVVEDRSTAELVFDLEMQTSGLAGLVAPERLITIGTLSKLLWGGLRIGWIRSDPSMVARMAEVKQMIDVTTSVIDQFLAAEALANMPAAIEERRRLLIAQAETTMRTVGETCPAWSPLPPEGGSGLWVDIHSDAIEYAMRAQSRGIRIAAGPAFSVSHGFETHIRLPISHQPGELRHALSLLG